ncbi:glucosidase 2 subunit beta [Dorcoceras hygrometricum]|uniref:Glucosidase 2 subunit beta n=1 Tax=Dorcoceras hygrometricum TaxID=472368 RepID=A0A2Z7B980_9LAMI|nr:glucosidase 2 subunit beta [Dorcoceras hygrometricum]
MACAMIKPADKNEEQVEEEEQDQFWAGEDFVLLMTPISVPSAVLKSLWLVSSVYGLTSRLCIFGRILDFKEMAPSAPRTRAAAALRMKQIALDNQYRTIRRLRAQLATERRGLAAKKKELEETRVALEASHKVIAGLTEIGLSMSKKIERMKVKKQQVRANHVECHQKFQARIHEAEDSMQAQHLIIERP